MRLVQIVTAYQGANTQWTSIDPESVESVNPAQIQCEGVWRPGTEIVMRSGSIFRSPYQAPEILRMLSAQPTPPVAPAAPVAAAPVVPGALPVPGSPIPAMPPAAPAPVPGAQPDPYAAPQLATVVDASAPFTVPPAPTVPQG